MTYVTDIPRDFAPFDRPRLARSLSPGVVVGLVTFSVTVMAGACLLDARRVALPSFPVAIVADLPAVASPPVHRTIAAAPAARHAMLASLPYDPLLDPGYSLGQAPAPLAASSPLAADFRSAAPAPAVVIAAQDATTPVTASAPKPQPEVEVAAVEPAPDAPILAEAPPLPVSKPMPDVAPEPEAEAVVPFPTPRPPDLRTPTPAPPRVAVRPFGRQPRSSAVAAAPPDNRGFFEKLFGLPAQPPGPMLAYAAPDAGILGRVPSVASTSMMPYDRYTAVYDIAAHTVFMPNGERLEAHSGLGQIIDDPRYVNVRNRGATPPHLYDLQLREQMFHGVQAIRLNPVGGGGVFGRNGLLAHTYMLGPNGDSNGCVSFRNYRAFLQAFSNGEIRRLAVVARS